MRIKPKYRSHNRSDDCPVPPTYFVEVVWKSDIVGIIRIHYGTAGNIAWHKVIAYRVLLEEE